MQYSNQNSWLGRGAGVEPLRGGGAPTHPLVLTSPSTAIAMDRGACLCPLQLVNAISSGLTQLDGFARALSAQNHPKLPGHRTQCFSPGYFNRAPDC
jgi:hypothetical protein